jgi:hypothetical protein
MDWRQTAWYLKLNKIIKSQECEQKTLYNIPYAINWFNNAI